MKKLLLFIIIFSFFSCKERKQEYYSTLIFSKYDEYGDFYVEEDTDTIYELNDSLAYLSNYRSFVFREEYEDIYPDRTIIIDKRIIDHKIKNSKGDFILFKIDSLEKIKIKNEIIAYIKEKKAPN